MITQNVLIIDDHPIIASAYQAALSSIERQNESHAFNIETVITIDEALEKLHSKPKKEYQLIFLDIKLPVSASGNYFSGEDLGVEIRATFPECKIIIATTYNDNYRINNILKSVNPDGFLVKNDLNEFKPINTTKL